MSELKVQPKYNGTKDQECNYFYNAIDNSMDISISNNYTYFCFLPFYLSLIT